jgi:hypothetical protein
MSRPRGDLAILLAAGLCSLACRGRQAPGDAPSRPPAGAARGTFELTYYWVESQPVPDPPEVTLFAASCDEVARVSHAFAKDLALAGTAKLADGRVIGIDGDCGCKRSPCVHVLPPEQPWGCGVDDRPLVPFRSVAVDRGLVPIGTSLYIEELDGAHLPTFLPAAHDGCVVADDTGDRITGQRLDWFIGRHLSYRVLDARLHLTGVTVHDGGERCPR